LALVPIGAVHQSVTDKFLPIRYRAPGALGNAGNHAPLG
jgi:hypothetical protein